MSYNADLEIEQLMIEKQLLISEIDALNERISFYHKTFIEKITIEMEEDEYDSITELISRGKKLGAEFTDFWYVYKDDAKRNNKPIKYQQEELMKVWLGLCIITSKKERVDVEL